MIPDYERAATMAAEMLKKHSISTAPVMPLPVFKKTPGCLVLSFTEMSKRIGIDRENLLTAFDAENHDAVTSTHFEDGQLRYLVTYNQRLPLYLVQRALARELAHIVLLHDGSRPEEVRNTEAKCFAHHLLVPRPLIHAVKASGIRLTMEVLNNLTGCNDYCVSCMRRLPPVHVPAELNRAVRDLMMPYIFNYFEYQRHATHKDASALADLGNYMEGYEECQQGNQQDQ